MFNHVLSNINWLHVVVATVAYFVLGAVWYSPVLFAKRWAGYAGMKMDDPEAKKGMGAIMGGSFVLMLITTIGLSIMQQVLPAIDFMGGIKLGLLIGICFAGTAVSTNYLYTRKPFGLYAIDCGYHILGIAIASGILSGWH